MEDNNNAETLELCSQTTEENMQEKVPFLDPSKPWPTGKEIQEKDQNEKLLPEGELVIKRPVYNKVRFDETFGLVKDERTCMEKCKKTCISSCSCSTECFLKKLFGFFPFISVLKTYQWKSWVVKDLIAGISVGLVHIPQGMGFAMLTSVPAVYGLYSSFFPVLLYFFFGTSNHISVGTMALISLMIGASVERETADFWPKFINVTQADNSTELLLQENPDYQAAKVGVATAVTFWAGIIQIVLGFLNLGIVSTFMSMPFVSGFMTGAACQIVTGQVKFCLGIVIPRHDGMFTLPKTLGEIFTHISETNIATLLISLICIFILVVLKEVINVKFKDKLPIPIPAELIVVVIATLASYYGKFSAKYEVKIIKHVSRGFPAPTVPDLGRTSNLIVDSFVVAIVSFAISISLAKIYMKKYKYQVDPNQELKAYGISFAVSAFFHSFGGAAAPPRCTIHDSTGGKTQVASLWSCLLLLLVILAMGPLFQPLPNCVLASIIIVALIPLFKQFSELPTYLRINKYDFAVWLITWLSVVVLDVSTGIGIGIGVSMLTVPIQSWLSSGVQQGRINETDLYASEALVDKAKVVKGVRIYRFQSNLIFVNVERFKSQLFGISVNPALCPIKKDDNEDLAENNQPSPDLGDIRWVIADCSAISYADFMGLNVLKSLGKEYHDVGVNFVLAACGESLLEKLANADVGGKDKRPHIYPTVHDAVAAYENSRFSHLENGVTNGNVLKNGRNLYDEEVKL